MSLARQPRFDPEDDDDGGPEPLPDGRLTPPPRKPPTAVATATPPPPNRNFRLRRYAGITRLQRVARTALGSCLLTAGIAGAYLAPLSLITLASAIVSSGGALVICRAMLAPSLYRGPTRVPARRRRRPRRS